jgi:hypothetical protein
LQPGQRLVAVVLRNGKDEVCWINVAATFPGRDLALIKVNLDETKWLQVADSLVPAGTDVRIIGIPSHEVWNAGKEMRLLKGHITLSGNFLELNFPVPLGMSGAPVFIGSRAVVAFATGSVRSEEIEDYEECVAKISNDKEEIRITEVRRVIQYGLAFPFSHLRGHKTSVLDDKTLMQFIEERNRS